MCYFQTFTTLLVSRFQNINPEKDGATIKGPSDLKSEIKIITVADDHFALWKEFLEKHHSGSLINPDTMMKYNEAKNFKLNYKFQLNREFFKHFGHFTDFDFKVYAQHLLGKTPNWTCKYPKVSVHKPVSIHPSHHSGADWVERRKRKRIVLEELDDLKQDLGFINMDGSVNHDAWRAWKDTHRVSSGSWNVLLTVPPAAYFSVRGMNEGKLKRASELLAKFPQVLPFFRRFLHCKERLRDVSGSIRLRTQDSVSLGFHKNWEYNPTRALGLGVMDLREIPGNAAKDDSLREPYFQPVMRAFKTLKQPSITEVCVWVFIFGTQERATMGVNYAAAHMKDFDIVQSIYHQAKNERLYDSSGRGQVPNVYLVFLFKKGNDRAQRLRANARSDFKVADCAYYLEHAKYQEAKYCILNSELRMEFYLELLKLFTRPGENILGVYSGSKCMLAARVSMSQEIYPRLEDNVDHYILAIIVCLCYEFIVYIIFEFFVASVILDSRITNFEYSYITCAI